MGTRLCRPIELERYRLRPAQVLSRRNSDLYLWGLPMKLKDPGTRLDPRVMRRRER